MFTKEEITEAIKEQFASLAERGQVLGQALKARADIAATRRRLRLTFAELGENVYDKMANGQLWNRDRDGDLTTFKLRIEGLQAELRQREKALQEILAGERIEAEGAGTEKAEDEEEETTAGSKKRLKTKEEEKKKTGKTGKSAAEARVKASTA